MTVMDKMFLGAHSRYGKKAKGMSKVTFMAFVSFYLSSKRDEDK